MYAHQKAVELGFRQGEGADLMRRVLGGDNEKGLGQRRVSPSVVTCRSSIASSRALWAFGVARLISSANTSCEKTGPG